ncbi:hypothetical protein OEA41_002802 [Lepraria neglecta]|uniref:SigF-like NTF2-like domain-containing protein n=1 Tax=Lepraria neglecta TaxID=209136 RepID=A0AAD9Z361_9LECA|nr:hypothetical protein OEA41_002802 [Lepraria neglecta]
MEDPQSEIPRIIHLLTQSPPSLQRATLEKYFTPNASFTHPICRTGSFEGSRWLIWCIYRWYKILSPRIVLEVDSVGAYFSIPTRDKLLGPLGENQWNVGWSETSANVNLILYVSLHQLFHLFFIPTFLAAQVSLTTVLHLTPIKGSTKSSSTRYLIRSQNDLYQVNELVKFFSLFGVVSVGVFAFQFFATVLCVLGAVVFWPISWVEQNVVGGNRERSLGDAVKG